MTCITLEYEVLAKKVAAKLARFFDFSWKTAVATGGAGTAIVIPVTVDLTTPIRVARRHRWWYKHYPTMYFFFEPKRLSLRREFAERLFSRAKGLDELIANAKRW